ncbi:MAG TPA: divalent metal cation transporter, partial [Lacibacter sp.]|nr:divalent metal cation transporter [Lacibacter sp.]
MRKRWKTKLRSLWRVAGPGFITGASDDDPSGIAPYTQAGAAFGYQALWTAWITFPLMVSIQEMCARIGLVQQKGLTAVIKAHYPRWLLSLLVGLSFPAIALNIGANLAAMGAVGNLLFPAIHPNLVSLLLLLILLYCLIRFPYRRIAAVLKWLCLVLLVYLLVPFYTRPDILSVLKHTLVPTITLDAPFLAILVAILGTTISPYLFFWQANMEQEEACRRHLVVDRNIITHMRRDIRIGMFYSNLIMFFIMLTAGSVLHMNGLTSIATVEDAAKALLPLAGRQAALLFSVGIIGTGMLAIPVLAGSVSYMVAETFSWREGLNRKFHRAKGFYYTMILSVLIGFTI